MSPLLYVVVLYYVFTHIPCLPLCCCRRRRGPSITVPVRVRVLAFCIFFLKLLLTLRSLVELDGGACIDCCLCWHYDLLSSSAFIS